MAEKDDQIEKEIGEPIEESIEKPIEEPIEEPIEKPIEEPSEEPSEEPEQLAETHGPFDALPTSSPLFEEFARALKAQGFTDLTEVQEAVLSAPLAGRDLRISSQTGSGKTVAVGFVLADAYETGQSLPTDGSRQDTRPKGSRNAFPKALVVAPTRELAAQLGKELSWMYGRLHIGIAVVTGGTAVGGDLRALAEGPGLVIGTPGRLVDHLERGSLDLSQLSEIVLDEADEMLDMGFRDELESILERTPKERRTHLVSATFPPKVKALADRYQNNAVLVEGTVGSKHQDISHAAIVTPVHERTNALVNLLLLHPDERFLVFVRTRVAASGVAGELSGLGFAASPLSGEMAQRERTRCLADFRSRKLQCVVATDVAARGLDIRGVQKIVHYDLPDNREAFTHRSGRTGRAGEKGESIIFVAPRGRRRVEDLFRILKADAKWRTPPTPEQIKKAARRRLLRQFGAVDPTAGAEAAESQAPEEYRELAEQLLARRPAQAIIADLLAEVGIHGPTEPREIRVAEHDRRPAQHEHGRQGARGGGGRFAPRDGRRNASRPGQGGSFVPFHVTWGFKTGASAKRVLAHLCRRGNIEGSQVGAIKIHDFRSVVDISSAVAESFERAVAAHDPRNPKVNITRFVPLDQRQSRGEGRDKRQDDRGREEGRKPKAGSS